MMTTRPWPSRIYIKLFGVQESWPKDAEAWIPLFQRWIREDVLPGTWIDVADYSHVSEGPTVLLAGLEGNISVDLEDGEPGLLYQTRLKSDLRDAIGVVARAAAAVEAASEFRGELKFARDRLTVGVNDRLHWCGGAETDDSWAALVEHNLAALGYVVRSTTAARREPGERPRALVSFDSALNF